MYFRAASVEADDPAKLSPLAATTRIVWFTIFRPPPTNARRIVGSYNAGNDGWEFYIDGGNTLRFRVGTPTGGSNEASLGWTPQPGLYLALGSYDEVTIRLNLYGVGVATQPYAGTPNETPNRLAVGTNSAGPSSTTAFVCGSVGGFIVHNDYYDPAGETAYLDYIADQLENDRAVITVGSLKDDWYWDGRYWDGVSSWDNHLSNTYTLPIVGAPQRSSIAGRVFG
jgi:hypothetical protein